VVGSPWRVSLDNPSCRTFYKEPASNGNSSTITIVREQCQTQIWRRLRECFKCKIALRATLDKASGATQVGLHRWGYTGGATQALPLPWLLLPCPAMDYLWTPWRYAYVSGSEKTVGCVFCEAPKEKDDAKTHIVYRGQQCFVILNTYPYTPGHVMIVPYTHLDELRKLRREAADEMIALSQRMESVLRELYRPDGINLGMNIGKAAGAGIAGHIHMHVLPRWVADANFVSVVGETRVLPETLEVTWGKMRNAMQEEFRK
jgi:ATP adenylyltransferase